MAVHGKSGFIGFVFLCFDRLFHSDARYQYSRIQNPTDPKKLFPWKTCACTIKGDVD